MAYNPVSGFTLQTIKQNGQTAEGYYLKFYIANTTTPLSMATDATGGTLLSEAKLNDNGMPISNPLDNSTVFIPHVNQSYRLVIYRNKADADANDTASAFVNIPDASPVLRAVGSGELLTRVEFTNIAGQSTITIDYNVGLIEVLYNGVHLNDADYTATSGKDITLTQSVALSTDVITVIRFAPADGVIGTGTMVDADQKDFAKRVDSIAELPSVGIEGNQQVSVKGYHAGSSVGGGLFVWNTSARHDGVIYFDPDRSGEIGTAAYYVDSGVDVPCWERVNYEPLYVEMAGAKGDGVTDDTAPINAALLKSSNVFANGGIYVSSRSTKARYIGDGKFIDLSSQDNEAFINIIEGDTGKKTRKMACVIRNPVNASVATITAASQTNPIVITASGHGFTDGNIVKITDVSGMTEINNRHFTIANATATTFELSGEDGTSYTAYTSGGSAEERLGWRFLDDVGHAPNGFKDVSVDTQTLTLNYNFTSSLVGSLLIAVDETFAQKGIWAGASVNTDKCLINFYQDLIGTIDNSTLDVSANEFFDDFPTATDNGDGTVTVNHKSTGKQEPPMLTLGSPGGTVIRAEGGFPKLISWTTSSFTYGMYDKLSGFVEWDGASWVVTTNSYTKPVVTAFSGYLQLNFGSNITPKFVVATSKTGVYLVDVFNVTGTNIQISFKDYSGANVSPSTPNTDMKFYFYSDEVVLQEIPADSYVDFQRLGAILNPKNFASNSGNFWVIGDMEI